MLMWEINCASKNCTQNHKKNGTRKKDLKTIKGKEKTGTKHNKDLKQHEKELNVSRKINDFVVKKKSVFKIKVWTGKWISCQSSEQENIKFTCNTNNVGYNLFCNTCKERGKIETMNEKLP